MYNVVRQVPIGAGGNWVVAPVESAAAQPEPRTAFTFNKRSFPALSPEDDYTFIDVHDTALLDAIRKVFPSVGSLYQAPAGIDARSVYLKRDELAIAGQGNEVVNELIGLLETEFAQVSVKLASFPSGMISWHLLWTQFEPAQELESVDELTGEKIAIRLDRWAYVKESLGQAFVLYCHSFQWAGTGYHKINLIRRIQQFADLRAISTLPAQPLSSKLKAELEERGELYITYVELSHLNHRGFFFTRAFTGQSRLLGDGQVVIDAKAFRRANPTLDQWGDEIDAPARSGLPPRSSGLSSPYPAFSLQQRHLLPPTLHGFSLRAKRWGEFLVSRLSEISWGQASFNHLVIPNSYRRIIQALVTVHAGQLKEQLMQDVVQGKGNGLIMALHGTPGTGKTLTAEAIAEHLHRPLYVVGIGELSLNPAGLERQLREILELATSWNAVLLIDEADIFLTRRSPDNLEHNALVGIFLRLLEYFSGVLILTTNLIDQLDEAFLSRFAVVLHFKPLNFASRRTLWSRFTDRVKLSLTQSDLDRLASFEMNGRDIQHAVRTAQAVALVNQEQLTMIHFEEVLAVAKSGFKLCQPQVNGVAKG